MPPAARDRLANRRRVVCSRILAEGADDESLSTARAKKQREQQRAAIRPAAMYQSGVKRRLRGRWFHLVPVKQHQLSVVLTGICVCVVSLMLLGYLAASWPPLALRPLVGRPLRLDAPGGIADWVGAQMLATAAGISFLIYQLRRYRGDDYHGRYRMWRPLIALLLLLSMDSVVHLREAVAALIDATWAQNSVIVGSDIVRLVLLLAGIAIGLPLFAELSRSPSSIVFLGGALISLAAPTALRLGMISSQPELLLTWAGAAKLAGRACILCSAICYLRRLYREVQNLDDAAENVSWRFPWKRRAQADENASANAKSSKSKTKESAEQDDESPGGFWSRLFGKRRDEDDDAADELSRRKSASKRRAEVDEQAEEDLDDDSVPDAPKTTVKASPSFATPKPREAAAVAAPTKTASPAPKDPSNSPAEAPAPKKSGLGGWLRAKQEPVAETTADKSNAKTAALKEEKSTPSETPAERKGWFSRSKPTEVKVAEKANASNAKGDAKESAPQAEKKVEEPGKKGWFGFGGKKDSVTSEPASSPPPPVKAAPVTAPKQTPTANDVADDEDDDEDMEGGDTSKMSRSELRRLKKQMKRQGRAA